MNREEWLRFLSGGIGALIPAAETPPMHIGPVNTQPETTAPEPQLQDREAYLVGNVTTKQAAFIGGGVLAGAALIYLLTRL